MSHQLKVTLEGVEPTIWRRIVVPSEFTLFDLHRVIQVAMGWEDCHLHDFTIKRQRYAEKLEALANPDDEDNEELRDWIGEDFDPNRFEKDDVNRELLAIFQPAPRRMKRPARSK